MEEIKIDDSNKDRPQETSKLSLEQNKTKNNYISMMSEEETSLWLKKLNLNEDILAEIGKVIKNGRDLISIYDNKKILEKLNIDFHLINIINTAIEEGLEEQLKINILLQKGKNIILNVENEPKFKLKEILSYLEKLMKKTVYLTPLNSPNELLTPNTLIVKKILLNPNKYCKLQMFDEKTIANNYNTNLNTTNVGESNTKNIPYKKIENININKKEISYLNDNDNLNNINNINQNNNNLNLVNQNQNLNNPKISNVGKGYISLFQNKKNNIPDFTTDYKMSSQNRTNGNNYIKIDKKNITPSKPIEDFKYQNLLSMKDKEEKDNNNIINDLRFLNDNNINDAKNIGFKNISNTKNMENQDNDLNSINKNYFTQRNFNSKTISNDPNNNNLMFQQILNKKRSEKNLADMMGKKTIDNLEEDNSNLSFLERNKNKEKDIFKFGKENNDIKKQINNKTENRYEFARFLDLDKDNFLGNKNAFNFTKTNPENNDIDNLIIKTQNLNIKENSNEELTNSKEKYMLHNDNDSNVKGETESDLLKGLREKYSLNSFNQDNKEVDNNKINIEIKKDYKPKTPINDTRRNIPDNIRFNNLGNENSNNMLENKFLMGQNEDFSKFNNYLNNNNNLLKMQLQQQQEEDDNNNNNNFITKIKMDNKINKNKLNRPSPGLEFKPFQYQTSGYRSSIQQNNSNQFGLEDE